jgi:hypothetical protein
MSKPTIRIHNAETDEIIDREMTNVEYAEYQAGELAAKETKAKAETDKAALLAKLGISADEAKLLLS